MYGIIAEDDSDAATLSVIVRRLARNDRLSIMTKGYHGCGELLKKGARQLKAFADLGCNRLIACHDADGPDNSILLQKLMGSVIIPSGHQDICCAVIPVQELEAWILADIDAVSKVFTSWSPPAIRGNPESIEDPKEHLERLSRAANGKPRYAHVAHNANVAVHLNLSKIRDRCHSFRPLWDFVRSAASE